MGGAAEALAAEPARAEATGRGSPLDASGARRRRPLFWLALAFCAGLVLDDLWQPGLPALGGFALSTGLLLLAVALLRPALGWERGRPRAQPVRTWRSALPFAAAVVAGVAGGALRHAQAARFPPATDVTCRTPATPALAWLEGTVVEVRRAGPAVGASRRDATTWTLDLSALGAAPGELATATGRVQVFVSEASAEVPTEWAGVAPSRRDGPDRGSPRRDATNPPTGEDARGTIPTGEDGPPARRAAPGSLPTGEDARGSPPAVREGDRLRLLARLEAPAPATRPDGFDSANYLARQGIRRVGETAADTVTPLGTAPWWRADLWLRRWGGVLARRNIELLGADRAALLNALLLGRRDGLDRSDRQAFALAGTAHLLAISGLHVQFVAAAAWWLLRCLRCRRRWAGLAVALFVFGFAALAGADPPVMRAAVMIGVYLGGILVYRAADPLSVLGAAALAILFFRPEDLFTAGFQLSFLAVLALVTIYPTLEAAWRAGRKFPEEWVVDPDERLRVRLARGLRQAVFISFSAWLGAAPAVAWHMGYFNLVSLATNLVAVPLTSVAMLGGALAMATGGVLGELLTAPLMALLGFNRWMGGLPCASLDVPAPPVVLAASYFAILGWAWFGRGRSATWPRLAALLPAALLVLVAAVFFRSPPAAPRVTVLDLPRGRAALVETPAGDAALVDCGGPGQGRTVAEILRRQGRRDLALLVLTEDSPDALGGAAELLEHLTVRRVVTPRGAAPSGALRALQASLVQRGIPQAPAEFAGSLRGPGDLRWEFATDAPEDGPPRTGSEALAVRVTLAGSAVLFVAARSSAGLKRLLARADGRLQADVLRLTPGPAGHWPPETALLIARSGARTLVAGEGSLWPEEGGGLDLAELAQARGLRLLCPHREGSLQFGESGPGHVLAYRAGEWREVTGP